MTFKLFLENSGIKITQKSDDGTSITIVFPSSGVYYYTIPHYGQIVNQLYKQNYYAPGKIVQKLKEMIDKGMATVEKIQ